MLSLVPALKLIEHKGVGTIWHKALAVPEKRGSSGFFFLDGKLPMPFGALNPNANPG